MSVHSAPPPINLAPFGRYTRYMLAAYLRHILIVIAALMTIALTIDLWPQIPLLTSSAGPALAWTVAWLGILRISDLMPPFIPFATFLGVVWSEGIFTQSRERMLIWNSGRSPVQCMMPAAMTGLVMGAALFITDGFLRPAAIAVQMREKLGREGIRLDRTQSGASQWIALPGGLVRARIEYGPPVRLHDTTIYKLDNAGHLSEVDTAALAIPLGDDQWQLQDGHYWSAAQEIFADGDAAAHYTIGSSRAETEIPFAKRIIPLTLNVLWLGNLGLSPQYLPLPVLRTLAHAHIDAHDDDSFRTRLQTLYGDTLMPGAMALLAAALSMLFFAYRTPTIAMVTVLLTGYLAHFTAKAFGLMGEFGYIDPFIAGWFAPLALFLGVGGVLFTIQKRRGLSGLRDTPALAPDA